MKYNSIQVNWEHFLSKQFSSPYSSGLDKKIDDIKERHMFLYVKRLGISKHGTDLPLNANNPGSISEYFLFANYTLKSWW